MRNRAITRAGQGLLAAVLLIAGAACKGDKRIVGPVTSDLEPEAFDARYEWVLHGWEAGGVAPIGHAGVLLTWALPGGWDREPFRVYGRQAGSGSYTAIATVTSCAEGTCSYTDLNVTPGRSYDYFVATVDERRGTETESEALRVDVPSAAVPQRPGAPAVTALDGALYLTWESTGAERYRVFLEQIGGTAEFIEIGETDGTSFLDERAENGVEYGYRIAAIDEAGQFSDRSPVGAGIPRPDYHTELLWAHGQVPTASGFRFQASEGNDPILAGTAASAQWRLEEIGGALSIVPLGQTTVTVGYWTSALTCGPAADSDCESVTTAPASTEFAGTPVEVAAGNTYVFRVVGDDGNPHYAKIRVQGVTGDTGGNTVVVFDWAYQLQPNQPSLSIGS